MLTSEEVLKQSRMAFGQWETQWREHSKKNGELYKKNRTSHKDFLNSGIGKQLLIIATGASLERKIDIVKKYREKCDIACVDKSFGILMDHGIKPDFVVIADANVSWEKWAARHADQTDGITLIANVNCAPDWTHNWKGKVVFYVNKDNIQSERIFMEISGCNEVIPAASNVGNTAVVFFAQIAKYDQYLLLGYDYSWKPGENYYAFDNSEKRYWMRHIYIVGIDGELCYTSQNLHFSARWLQDYCEKQVRHIKIFNCSGTGCIQVNPQDLEKKLAQFEPRKMTGAELNMFYNSRLETEVFPYNGPEDFIERMKQFKYIAGIKVDFLPANIYPAPDEVAV